MNKTLMASALVLSFGASSALAAQPPLKNEDEKTLYALGISVGQSLQVLLVGRSNCRDGESLR